MQEPSPIIIFGAPRSGTTYLNNLLNAHPDVFISHEIRLFAWLHDSLHVLTRQDRCLVCHRDLFVRHLQSAYPQMIRDFYAANWPRARYWGDKNPHYAQPQNRGCLNTIAELFPGAKFIHIIRDGRDVVSSLIRKRHADGRPWVDWENAHHVWTGHVSLGCEFGRGVPANQYFELKYENLIADDVGYARKLFEFLGIPLHPAVVHFCEEQLVTRTNFSGATRDLSAGASVSDWATLLIPTDQLRSIDLLAEELVRQGYESEESIASTRNRLTSLVTQLQIETIPNRLS